MKKDTEIFLSNIHDTGYLSKFDKNKRTHETMIYDAGREKESLNGSWNFTIDPYDNCLRSEWFKEITESDIGMQLPLDYDLDQWEKINVPSCWNMHKKEYFWYEGSAVYTRKFRYENRGEKKVFIKFGAANYCARVFLNREFIGWHEGGSTPFYFDVTGLLEKENRILVVVENTRRGDRVPMDNTDWFNYGGIYRDVEIIRLPENFIKDFTLGLVPDRNFDKISFSVEISKPDNVNNVRIKINELDIDEAVSMTNGCGKLIINKKPALWSPADPKLYDIEISYGQDVIKEKVGFREIIVHGTDIFLNGERIFLKGICFHEESVENGKAVHEDEIIENLKIGKDLGCNYVRLAHYPHTEKAARLADEIGIMLWEEIPVYWGIDFENKNTHIDAENQLAELIKRDKNRASVVIWSVGNENPDTEARLEFMKSLALKAKQLDPSRPVSAACLVDHVNLVINDRLAEYLDIIGINEYYGWYEPDITRLKKIFDNSKPDKPVIISEFGADAKAGERGSDADLWTEDKQLALYKKQVDIISKIKYINGMTPWILFDFRCPRRNNPFQRFYNRKGLLSEDKKIKKLAYFCLKEFYERNL